MDGGIVIVEEDDQPDTETSLRADADRKKEIDTVMHLVMGLPGKLPSSLWGWDMSDLAEAIVDSPHKDAPDGTPLVELKGRWYLVDLESPDTFLKEFEEA